MGNQHQKKCSTSLITRKMQIETTVLFHFMPSRMVIIKKRENEKVTSIGENVEKLGHIQRNG